MGTPERSTGKPRVVTSGTGGNGQRVRADLTGRRMDALRAAAGLAHRDAARTSSSGAASYGTDARTQRRWFEEGPPVVREFTVFLSLADDVWRWVAHVKTTAKVLTLQKLTDEQLIERIRELRAREKAVEGEDNANDVRRGLTPLERAMAKERDAALDEELAAAFRVWAERPWLTEAEVLHG